jgi:hypothetical protein
MKSREQAALRFCDPTNRALNGEKLVGVPLKDEISTPTPSPERIEGFVRRPATNRGCSATPFIACLQQGDFLLSRMPDLDHTSWNAHEKRITRVWNAMIYRRKVMPEAAFNDLVERYQDTFRALKEPSGAALFVSRNTSPDRTVFLSQDYSEAFERLSPGNWESIYDADLSTCDFAAGDIRMTVLTEIRNSLETVPR